MISIFEVFVVHCSWIWHWP